jgi:DNA repair exonuclease SbcCD nuclease subunit
MKVLLYSDNHWTQYSSIVRRRGEKYSLRLENQIQSLNWVEQTAIDYGCKQIICLGDFFDKESLNSEELSALNEINWSQDIYHYFIVGNHEIGINNLKYNSAKVFNMLQKCDTISEPQFMSYNNILLIPYDLNSSNKSIKDYFNNNCIPEKLIVLSHNDIKGIQYGKYTSQSGFDLNDIENNCALFINGHLHNNKYLNDKKTILNLGNLTGQNFSEDASVYTHNICILDTDTLKIELIENPYAFNFYKLNFTNSDIVNIKNDLSKLKNNAVITIKAFEKQLTDIRNILHSLKNIVESRIIIEPEVIEGQSRNTEELVKLNYIEQFNDYILNTLGNDKLVLEELEAINVN